MVVTLNEIVGMKAIMPKIDRSWVDQIIVLDGGSTDGTQEYAKEQGYFVYRQKEPGLRYAYREALSYIDGEVLITFSPDGNCLPELIPVLVGKMAEGYDMVVASRYKDDATSEDDDIMTGFGNWLFTRTANLLYGANYTDVMGIYRAYRTQIIHDLEVDKDDGFLLAERLFQTRIGWEPLLSIRAARRKLKVTEIPGPEPARIGGERKLQVIKWGGALYFQFLTDWFRWR